MNSKTKKDLQPPEKGLEFADLVFSKHYQTLITIIETLCKKANGKIDSGDLVMALYMKLVTKSTTIILGYEKRGVPYIIKILKNIFYDIGRKHKSEVKLKEVYKRIYNESEDLEVICNANLMAKQVAEIINQLPGTDGEVIQMYLDGYSAKEIAEVLGTNSNNIHQRVNRIKKKIKESLEE